MVCPSAALMHSRRLLEPVAGQESRRRQESPTKPGSDRPLSQRQRGNPDEAPRKSPGHGEACGHDAPSGILKNPHHVAGVVGNGNFAAPLHFGREAVPFKTPAVLERKRGKRAMQKNVRSGPYMAIKVSDPRRYGIAAGFAADQNFCRTPPFFQKQHPGASARPPVRRP